MSHTTTIDALIFTDMQALRSAITELKATGVNCELLENATPRAYYEDQTGMGQAPFVVKLDDASYDVGLYDNKEGGYEARTDFYGGSVERVLGSEDNSVEPDQRKMGKLYQMYGIHAATRKAIQQGYSVNRVAKQDGSVQLRIGVAA